MVYLAYAAAWISTAAAAIVGMIETGSAWCLWVMLIPALIKINDKE